jgi:NAD(P)-dependent dehydrogenase (short-subunit alcohol dehydrogenase family)
VIEQAGEVDVLVNDAGVFPGALTHEIDEDTFDVAFAVNVNAPVLPDCRLGPEDG